MQQAQNKLKEIIWEITDNCSQNCSYCGSKNILNKTPIDEVKLMKIIDNIASFPPEEINISGGNPLLVSYRVHRYLIDTLHSKNVVCKIIINPYNIQSMESDSILDIYDWIGLSVNTKSELEQLKNWTGKGKITVITNFNTNNIFLFNEIQSVVLQYNLTWQVQYTMYQGDNDLAIYQNEAAKIYLMNQINTSPANIIKADNMNTGNCSAGLYSCGILANGDVIPCLSMRSWKDDLLVKGNLLSDSFFKVWCEGFAIFRCNEFECCKDITKCQEKIVSKELIESKPQPAINIPTYVYAVIKPTEWIPTINYDNITMMYGVGNQFIKERK